MASSAFWNSTLMVLLYLSSGREMTSASILLKLHGLEDGSFDPKDFEVAKPEGSEHKSPTPDKRQSTTGTCTCTCETKPISNTTSTSASSSSSEWTAETSAAETSARKQPHPPPEMVASSLRTDTSGRHQGASSSSSSASAAGGGGASDAGKLKMRTQMEDAADDNDADADADDDADADEDEDGGDSNKIIDADITDNLQSDWGHGSRFLWKRLPDRMCYRESCLSDKDCCLWYNLCDRSAKVCVDCWYGSPCTSERDCCIRYPYCELEEDRGIGGLQQLKQGGKKRSSYAGQCVDQIS